MGGLAVVGGGRMGEALIAGALTSGTPPTSVVVVEPDEARASYLEETYGLRTCDLAAAVATADRVLVSVKPAQVTSVLRAMSGEISEGCVVISVAAGVTLDALQEALPPGTPVVRAMPNTPALISYGMTALSANASAGPAMDRVRALFEGVGDVVEVAEADMDAVTAVSGSGPAYVFYVAEAMVDAAVALGLPRALARQLTTQTLRGAAEMMHVTGDHPVLLREAVSSPGGTTVAAVGRLESAAVRAAFADAMGAAAHRSADLGRST